HTQCAIQIFATPVSSQERRDTATPDTPKSSALTLALPRERLAGLALLCDCRRRGVRTYGRPWSLPLLRCQSGLIPVKVGDAARRDLDAGREGCVLRLHSRPHGRPRSFAYTPAALMDCRTPRPWRAITGTI